MNTPRILVKWRAFGALDMTILRGLSRYYSFNYPFAMQNFKNIIKFNHMMIFLIIAQD